MRPYFNQRRYDVSYNTRFEEVIYECRAISRPHQMGTWINQDIIRSYCQLHESGYAHSVEVWDDGKLVGGLYGMAIGRIFYGESMFAKKSNASKFGFISLVRLLKNKGIEVIDCQQETPHLLSLGATMISKEKFWTHLKRNLLTDDERLTLE